MDFENINLWCWLIPLLIGVICGILGYRMGKDGNTAIDNSAELKSLRDKNSRLQSELDACNKKLIAKPNGNTDTAGGNIAPLGATSAAAATSVAATPLTTPTATPKSETSKAVAFDAAVANAAFGKSISRDDLKIIEGIGPKIEEMFREAGIKTWKSLSETSVASCQEILNGGGERYKVHDPASWPMQAKMCYENKWRELVKWQEQHDHGKL